MARILLVENDPLQALLRKSTLEEHFDRVERVANAAEALCLIEQAQFAAELGLVVCGPQQPGFGGADFVTELRARLPRIPVLVLGGSGEGPEAYGKENTRFLGWPVGNEELLAAAAKMLRGSARTTA